MSTSIELAERGWLPDWAIRAGIRRQYERRLVTLDPPDPAEHRSTQRQFAEQLRNGPLVLSADKANAFIDMYVNEDSLRFSEDLKEAVRVIREEYFLRSACA